jgi:hypothetical protein
MVNTLSSPEQIHRDTSRWQPYAIILRPTITNSMPTFITTEDSLGIIPAGFPYPSGGVNLGIINGKVRIKKGANLEDEVPTDFGLVSDTRFYTSYKRTIELQLLSSGRKEVVDIFDDPGFSSDGESSGGGLANAPSYVLAMMYWDVHHEDVFLCYIHWAVTPLPADEELGGNEPSIINAVFRCYAGYNPDDPACLRPAGTQIWRKLYINSSGSMIDPDNPSSPIAFDPITDPWPALTMINMM